MKTILLAGSSIFQQWGNAAGIAPDAVVRNRAIGGTVTSYWLEHLARMLMDESPDAVLFYCGSNDVSREIPEAEIVANVLGCRRILQDQSWTARMAYFSIIKAPQKKGNWDLIDRLNCAIREGLFDGDLYVETNAVFFRDECPVTRLFVEDGLHLTDRAYVELSEYARPHISAWLD